MKRRLGIRSKPHLSAASRLAAGLVALLSAGAAFGQAPVTVQVAPNSGVFQPGAIQNVYETGPSQIQLHSTTQNWRLRVRAEDLSGFRARADLPLLNIDWIPQSGQSPPGTNFFPAIQSLMGEGAIVAEGTFTGGPVPLGAFHLRAPINLRTTPGTYHGRLHFEILLPSGQVIPVALYSYSVTLQPYIQMYFDGGGFEFTAPQFGVYPASKTAKLIVQTNMLNANVLVKLNPLTQVGGTHVIPNGQVALGWALSESQAITNGLSAPFGTTQFNIQPPRGTTTYFIYGRVQTTPNDPAATYFGTLSATGGGN
jgi:hypothetical protein